MRRFYAKPCHNIRWVFFSFAFVAVCSIRNGLRVDKTISVRLNGNYIVSVVRIHTPPPTKTDKIRTFGLLVPNDMRAGSSQGMAANSNYNLIEIVNRKLLKFFQIIYGYFFENRATKLCFFDIR